MPDPIVMGTAVVVAALVSGTVVLIVGWPWRAPRASRLQAGWVIGQCMGWVAGCWVLGVRPHWPVREDLDRLLVVVLPIVLVVELVAICIRRSPWLIWPLRVLVAGIAARVLLHGSIYLTGSAEDGGWPAALAWTILASMAIAVGSVWLLLSLLLQRAPGFSPWGCLAGTSAGAGLTVMLSGYATGGQVGLPLAGALLGSALASFLLPRSSLDRTPLGVAIGGLFCVLLIGRFFGELSWGHAALLLLAPLAAWAPEAPQLNRLKPRARGLLRLVSVGVIVGGVVMNARQHFLDAFQVPSATTTDESALPEGPEFAR